MIYFGSWMQKFQSMASWLCCFWVMVKQNILVEGHGRAKLLTLLWPGIRE
jgi:hypothetical protein